jgi:ABC-type lipoprotein release transport system permease subunit
VVISSIAIGIIGMLVSMAFMNSLGAQMIDNTISTSIGHIAIHKKGFQENARLELNFNPDKNIINNVSRSALAYAPKVKIQGMVRSSETARGVMIIGIDPAREKTVSNIHKYTSSENGSKYLDSPEENSILISKSMAKKLDLVIGDKLVLMLQDKHNEISGEGLIVKGIFESPFETLDKFVVYVGIKKLQNITGIGDNISEITILINDKNLVDPVNKALISGTGRPDLEILTWKDMAPDVVSAVKLFDQMMYIFFMIIFITVIFSVANILIMSIMERFHEIGVMKSIGTRPSRIFFMIMFEALNLCLAGLTFGIAVSAILIGIMTVRGLDLSMFAESMRVYGSGSILYPYIKTMDIVISFLIVIITAFAAAIYPAIKAARIKPLEALNFI